MEAKGINSQKSKSMEKKSARKVKKKKKAESMKQKCRKWSNQIRITMKTINREEQSGQISGTEDKFRQ